MTPGDNITIKATVLRVDGDRVSTQTPNGQLIQTDVSNILESIKTPFAVAGGKFEQDVKAASRNQNKGRR